MQAIGAWENVLGAAAVVPRQRNQAGMPTPRQWEPEAHRGHGFATTPLRWKAEDEALDRVWPS